MNQPSLPLVICACWLLAAAPCSAQPRGPAVAPVRFSGVVKSGASALQLYLLDRNDKSAATLSTTACELSTSLISGIRSSTYRAQWSREGWDQATLNRAKVWLAFGTGTANSPPNPSTALSVRTTSPPPSIDIGTDLSPLPPAGDFLMTSAIGDSTGVKLTAVVAPTPGAPALGSGGVLRWASADGSTQVTGSVVMSTGYMLFAQGTALVRLSAPRQMATTAWRVSWLANSPGAADVHLSVPAETGGVVLGDQLGKANPDYWSVGPKSNVLLQNGWLPAIPLGDTLTLDLVVRASSANIGASPPFASWNLVLGSTLQLPLDTARLTLLPDGTWWVHAFWVMGVDVPKGATPYLVAGGEAWTGYATLQSLRLSQSATVDVASTGSTTKNGATR